MTEPLGDPSILDSLADIAQAIAGPVGAALLGHTSKWARDLADQRPLTWRVILADTLASGLFGFSAAALAEWLHLSLLIACAIASVMGHLGTRTVFRLAFRFARAKGV